jgi:hypothetical protein
MCSKTATLTDSLVGHENARREARSSTGHAGFGKGVVVSVRDCPEPYRGVLGAMIAMVNQSRSGIPAPQRHVQGVYHYPGSQVGGHRPADHPPRVGIQNERQIHPALPTSEIRDVRHPQPVRGLGCEVALHQVGSEWYPLDPLRPRSSLASATAALKARFSHQPRHSLPAAANVLRQTQLGVHPGSTVSSTAFVVNGLGRLRESGVRSIPSGGRPAPPGVVAGV